MNTATLPALGLGTFRLTGRTAYQSVRDGLAAGYRLVDTAQIYGNEAEVGEALADSGLAREDVFLTTKVWTEHLAADRLAASLEESLAKLRTDHVDLALVHWPSPGGAVPLEETMAALAAAQDRGLTRLIGVSNFNSAQLAAAIDAVGADRIATHQIELHPWMQNRPAVAFARRHGVHVTSYMTLGQGRVLADPVIGAIAAARGATPAQVTLAWALQRGFAVIPSSTRPAHLASNLQAASLRLPDEDLAHIDALDRGERLVDPKGLAPVWD